METELAIQIAGLGKIYPLYDRPFDRLREALHPFKRKCHRDFHALRDVGFDVRAGETLGIIGRNGSGKSTLLKILAGVLTPTAGQVRVAGRVSSLLELGAGFNPEMTGLENVYLQGTLMGFTRGEMDERRDAILAFADIGEFISQPVKHYSSGMFVRLAFACAISVDPDILIVDEALAVGDVRFQVKCHRKLAEFHERGKTILLVSHSAADVVQLCQRAIWLDDGRIRKSGPAKGVVEEYSAWMVHDTGLQHAPAAAAAGAPETMADGLAPIPAQALITGDGGAVIEACGLFDEHGQRLAVLTGPTRVRLRLRVATKVPLAVPYFGFQVVNAKGLRVLGSNTAVLRLTLPALAAGARVQVEFAFDFPEIANGPYLLALGVADGTADRHVRHQYVADAYEFLFSSASDLQKQDVLLKLADCRVGMDVVKPAKGSGHGPA